MCRPWRSYIIIFFVSNTENIQQFVAWADSIKMILKLGVVALVFLNYKLV